MFQFDQYNLAVNFAIFAGASSAVWLAGTKLAYYADTVAERFQLSRALLGLLLLAGVTSLPEIATSFTAAIENNPELAVNNLLGSIAMQVAVLAIADGLCGKRALTSVVPDPVVILQGAVNIYLLSLVAIAILIGDKAFAGAGFWTWSLLVLTVFCFFKLAEASNKKPWHIRQEDQRVIDQILVEPDHRYDEMRTSILILKILLSAFVILVAGFVVAKVGDSIAEQSGLGSSFVGVAFVAIATSLPEASTVFASVKRGLYTMAISDILGTNILNVALIFFVDLISDSEPVLDNLKDFAAVAALLGIVVVSVFLIGLAERKDRTFFKFGTDSLVVISTYIAGLVFLFHMRG